MEGRDIDGRALMAKAKFIADCLYKTCVAMDDGKRLRETASISPAQTLKSLKARRAFEWASNVARQSRFYTMAACRLGVELLLGYPNVEVPILGTLSKDVWVQQQGKIVMHLCQRARRNSGSASLRFPAYRQSRSMDWEETQLMQDWILFVRFFDLFVINVCGFHKFKSGPYI